MRFWNQVYSVQSNLLVCRYYVAGLDEQAPHYLGHAMRFWNQVYSV
jgi:hypothetical protein